MEGVAIKQLYRYGAPQEHRAASSMHCGIRALPVAGMVAGRRQQAESIAGANTRLDALRQRIEPRMEGQPTNGSTNGSGKRHGLPV